MTTLGEDAVVLVFCMLELSDHGNNIVYVFMLNETQFYASIMAEKLEGEGAILNEFNGFKDDLDDLDNMFNFEEWVLGALDEFKLAPAAAAGAWKPITLLDYFSPPTYAFELINEEGHLRAIQEDYTPETHGDTSPRTWIVDVLSDRESMSSPSSLIGDMLSRRSAQSEDVLLHSFLPLVPHIQRVDDGLGIEELRDVPSKVRQVGTENVFFFKGGFTDHRHQRELEIFSQINLSDNFTPPFGKSRIAGLVFWDNDDSCLMGFLLEYIEGQTLMLWRDGASTPAKMKWTRQVKATVQRLPRAGIVWETSDRTMSLSTQRGMQLMSVFGGGYTPGYIELELQQTIAGDLIGLDHMAEEAEVY